MKNFFDAFISYGRADSKAFATKLYNKLVEQGLKVWFDQNDIPLGVDFQNQIDDGIQKAHNFIFIIAPHSVKSAYCLKEIQLAVKRNKRIIPLLHVEPSDCWDKMHPTIGKINWVYFREEQDDFEAAFSGLISLIRRDADYVEQHTRFLVKALEWERHQKQNSCLLIGEERQEAEAWLKIRFKREQPPCVPTDLHCEFISESTKNANNLMTQVFLCYSDKDKEVMKKLAKTIMREGFTVWTNKTDIKTGTEFQEEVNKGIEGANNIVCLISPAALQSWYWQQEIAHAFANNKRIIPLLIEPTELDSIHPNIRALQFIDFTTYQDEAKYRDDADKLVKILHRDERYYEEHKILLFKALKWQEQNRNHSILLRGHNLQYYEHWLKVHRHRGEHPPLPLQIEFITSSSNQPPESSLEVFISYSRADSDFARKLNEALQIQGKTTWFDQESIPPGSDFQQEIYRGIESSANFLFVISPRSVNSPYCADEVEYAQKLNKRFVTVLHTEVLPKELHPALASVQWIDFNRHGGDFYPNLSELVRTLDTDREHVKSHTKWSQRALEWEEKGKSADLLLRGSEFAIAQNWLQEAEQQNKQPAATRLQKEYITASREAIAAQLKREKGRVIILRSLLALVSTIAMVAIGVGVVAYSQYQEAERQHKEAEQQQRIAEIVTEGQINALSRYSLILSDTDRKLDALIEALRAGAQLQKQLGTVKSETQSQVVAALLKAFYEVTERNQLEGNDTGVLSASFSPNGQMIATGSGKGEKTVKLWSREGKLLKTFPEQQGVPSVVWSPDGQIIATASLDGKVKLWNLQGKLLTTSIKHDKAVWNVSFSPDGQTLATASDDKTVKLWNLQGKLLIKPLKHNEPVGGISFSPDGKMIATASGKTVKLWNREGKQFQILTGHTQAVYKISFSPDSKTIATASADKTVKVWNLQGKLLVNLIGHENKIWGVSFSPDGKTIATASADNTVRLWNRAGKLLKILNGHENEVYQVSFSSDGKMLATSSADNTVKLWTPEDWVHLNHTWNKHEVRSISLSPDGKIIATAMADKTVKLSNLGGRVFQTLKGQKDEVVNISFSPDSKTIATASKDKTVKLWNLKGKLLQTFSGHKREVTSVSFSPDGKTIATTSADTTAKLWNLEGEEFQILSGHQNMVFSATFSPDGKTIATASGDKTVKLWNLKGKLLQTFTGHKGGVSSVRFSPDGNMIATTSADKMVKLWNLQGQELQTLIGHRDKIWKVSFSRDGKNLATISNDRTLIVWNLVMDRLDNRVIESLTIDELMVRGCNWVRDYLKNSPTVEESDRTLCDGIGEK